MCACVFDVSARVSQATKGICFFCDVRSSPYRVSPYTPQLQVELLKCLKGSLNNQLGIDFLAARPEVVGILALNFGSEDVFICTQVLRSTYLLFLPHVTYLSIPPVVLSEVLAPSPA